MANSHFIAIAMAACCASAHADDAITAANNEIGLTIGGENIAYHESAKEVQNPAGPDGYLDSNIGTMPAVGLNLTRQGALFGIEGVYLSLNVSGAVGKTEYTTGSAVYQQCSGIPGTSSYGTFCDSLLGRYSESHSNFTVDAAAKIGKAFMIGSHAQLTPYLEYGVHEWQRSLSFCDCNYSHQEIGPGVLVQYALTRRLVMSANVSVTETLNARAREDGVDYRLGSRPVETVGLGIDYALTRRVHATASYSLQHFRYGASPVIAGSLEPNSWTTNQAVMLGLAYAL
jgi:opacity protein-like surface antigen